MVTVMMPSIEINEVCEGEMIIIGNWYNQSDKGWLYCDDLAYTDPMLIEKVVLTRSIII